jgi:hypothetical protein
MPGFWRKCRITFRWLRVAGWLILLAALCVFIRFNRVGLPDFIKTRLVATLHERGVELEFSRMRLRVFRGLVAENVRIGGTKPAGGPALAAREVQMRVNFYALLHRRLQVDGLVLRGGSFTLPLSPTNTLAVTNIQTDLRFQAGDTWSLDHFRAEFAGADISLSGEMAHAPEMRDWKMFTGGKPGDRGTVMASLKNLSAALAQVRFDGRPQLNLTVDGDARDLHSFTLRLDATTAGVRSPWFDARDLQLYVNLTAPPGVPARADPMRGFWTNLEPFRIEGTARLEGLRSEMLDADDIAIAGLWLAPELAVTKLSGQLGGGRFEATAGLDVATQRLAFTNDSSFDLHAVAALLTEKTRAKLAEISWTQPPALHAAGSLKLPPWPAGPSNWHDTVEPTVQLAGELAFTNAVAGGLPLDLVRTHFSYASLIWSLPDLTVAQGRTRLELGGEESEATKNFRCRVRGAIDAASVKPFLTTSNAVRGFALLTLDEPLALDLNLSGNLYDFSRLSATGRVALTNFAVRAEPVDSVAAELAYTNLTVDFFHPQLFRAGGRETMTAERFTMDLANQRLDFTNGFSTADPMAVARAIGPKAGHAVEPYHFLSLPVARANGCVPFKQRNGELVTDDADVRFDVVGTAPFRWQNFETPGIAGTVHWWRNYLILTNVVASAYGGEARGWANFDLLTPGPGTDLKFFISATNLDLQAMGRALWSPTNQLGGALSGWVAVTSANSDDWRSWNGHGEARLRNGMLWDFPIFGFVSPVLNTFSPGLGNNRATDATGRFDMTNGVVYSDSLEVHTTAMRLQYAGTVDLRQNMAARMTAQLMRNTPVVGSLVSTMLWPVSKIFECKVTGQLGDPKVIPVYFPFPKILLAPLHPLRSFEDVLLPPDTNAPAGR